MIAACVMGAVCGQPDCPICGTKEESQVLTLETNIRFGTKNPNEGVLRRGDREILRIRRRTPELLSSSLLHYCRVLGVDPNEVK